MIASSPGLFPAFQYCTLWEWDGPGDVDEATHVMQCNDWSLVFCFSQVIDKDGVFSVQANLSRLRAELTIQANKRYCILGGWGYSRKLLISMYTHTHKHTVSISLPSVVNCWLSTGPSTLSRLVTSEAVLGSLPYLNGGQGRRHHPNHPPA